MTVQTILYYLFIMYTVRTCVVHKIAYVHVGTSVFVHVCAIGNAYIM